MPRTPGQAIAIGGTLLYWRLRDSFDHWACSSTWTAGTGCRRQLRSERHNDYGTGTRTGRCTDRRRAAWPGQQPLEATPLLLNAAPELLRGAGLSSARMGRSGPGSPAVCPMSTLSNQRLRTRALVGVGTRRRPHDIGNYASDPTSGMTPSRRATIIVVSQASLRAVFWRTWLKDIARLGVAAVCLASPARSDELGLRQLGASSNQSIVPKGL